MNAFKRLIEANRQMGTSTALIQTVKNVGGYLIVSNYDNKNRKLKLYPELKGHIFTCQEIERGSCLGAEPGPIFFDTDAIWGLITRKEALDTKPTVIMLSENTDDGYRNTDDGYSKNSEQLNIKLSKEDMQNVKDINAEFFEGEASSSMMGRILLRKGIQFYKKLRDSL
jgi:hypothetical protein